MTHEGPPRNGQQRDDPGTPHPTDYQTESEADAVSVQPTARPLTDSEMTAMNGLAVQSMLDYLPLPAATLTPRPDAVHVTVTSARDLSRWLYDLGGHIRQSSGADGVALWTVHTQTPERGDGSTVPIRVHAVVVDGEDVIADVRPGGQS